MTRMLKVVLLAGLLAGCSSSQESPFDYCASGQAPDEACYASKRDPSSSNIALAERIARKQMEEHPAQELVWDWGESVMMVGIHELYRVTGDEAYRNYYRDWIDHHIEQGYLISTSDTGAPARLALELALLDSGVQHQAVVDDFFDYLDNRALRTDEGGINHLGTDGNFGVTLWVDSLFMFGGILIRSGEHNGDSQALEEFAFQHGVFTDLLQKESGWYKHAYDWMGPQDEDVFWGRGNGWVAAATVDYLRVRSFEGDDALDTRQALERLFAAIVESQDQESGLWWTIVNRPDEIYLETSASALFAYALARAYRYGFKDEAVLPVVESALSGVLSKIDVDQDERPVVTGVSGPTMAGTFDYYEQIPQIDDVSFGLGAVLLMLVETSGLPL